MARHRKRKLPNLAKRAKRLSISLDRWVRAGRPTRDEQTVAAIFKEHCVPCDHFLPSGWDQRGNCLLCGCRINLKRGLNKLRWATESCPARPPKWKATHDEFGKPITERKRMSLENRQIERAKRRVQRIKRRIKAEQDPALREGLVSELCRHEEALTAMQKDADDPEENAQATRREERARRKRKRKRWSPPVHEFPANTDPLSCTDKNKQPLGHVLRDIWRPNAGFLVCGGPSIRQIDLGFLRERGIVSLGINNVSGYAPVRAMTFSDPPEKFCHGVFFDPTVMKLVPVPKLGKRVRAKKPDGTFGFTSLRVMDCPNVWGYHRNSIWEPETFLTHEFATWGNGKKGEEANGRPRILFTFFLGLRLLHYLGCRQVFMIGADFSMTEDPDGTGGGGYAFNERRHAGAARGNNNSYRKANGMCSQLRPVFEAAGYEVYNCNPDSKLTAFDHVPLERAQQIARGLVPAEPWPDDMLLGWYAKDEDPENRKAD